MSGRSGSLSVLMPTYNHARFIPEALGAILGQSYRPLEVIVIDDASTDDSWSVLERYRATAPDVIRIVRNETNLGVLATALTLVAMAKGEYLYFAATDDRILPGFFERSMRLLSTHPEAGLCSTLSLMMTDAGRIEGTVRMPVVLDRDGHLPADRVLGTLRTHGNWFMGNTTIYRRACLEEAGGLRPELGPYTDGFASLVIALKYGACFVPEPLAIWRRMSGSYSQQTSGNLENTLRVLAAAEALMRTQFNDRFPADYVDEWKREMSFGIASSWAHSARADAVDQIARVVPPASRLDRALYAAARTVPPVRSLMMRPYLFLKLRKRHVFRMVWRRLAHVRLAHRTVT